MAAVGHVRRVWGSLAVVVFMSVSLTSAVAAETEAASPAGERAAAAAQAASQSAFADLDVLALVGGLAALAVAVLVAVGGRRYQLARGAA